MPLHREVITLLDLMEQVGRPVDRGAGCRRGEGRPPRVAAPADRGLLRDPRRRRRRRPGSPVPLGADAPRAGLLVWFHGGGWVIGDLDSHDNICRALTNRTGHSVLSIDYRLAPEDPVPRRARATASRRRSGRTRTPRRSASTPSDSPSAVTRPAATWLRSCATRSPSPIRFQLLVYPVTDGRANSVVIRGERDGLLPHRDRHAVVHRPVPRRAARAASTTRGCRRCWPIRRDVRDAPAGARDHRRVRSLRDEGDAYAERLSDAGVVTHPRALRRPDPRVLHDARHPVRRPRRPRHRRRSPHPRPPLSRSREQTAAPRRSLFTRTRRARRPGRRRRRASARSGAR